LKEQRKELKEHIKKYEDKYDLNQYKDGEKFPHTA
jgi:hypothetical protein